jgi:hypothetical protein
MIHKLANFGSFCYNSKKLIFIIMKKIFILGLFILLLSFGRNTYADYCTLPTTPVCYTTVTTPIYPSQGSGYYGPVSLPGGGIVMPDSTGSIGNTTQQVQVACDYTDPLEFQYRAQMDSYNSCLQSSTNHSVNLQPDSGVSPATTDNASLPTPVCPYPIQPTTQSSQSVIDTTSFSNGLTVKKYSNGSYAIFNDSGQYEGQSSSENFNTAKQAEESFSQLSSLVSDPVRFQAANMLIKIGRDEGNSIQVHLDTLHAYDRSCLIKTQSPKPSTSSMTPSDLNKTMQDMATNLYGPQAYYNTTTDKFECNAGYIFEKTNYIWENTKCIPLSSQTSIYDSISKSDMSITDPPAQWCAGVHGPNTQINQSNGKVTCSCADGYTVGPDASCIFNYGLAKPQSTTTKTTNITSIKISKIYSTKVSSSTQNIATATSSSLVVKTHNIKHWYQWLNPFSWFK